MVGSCRIACRLETSQGCFSESPFQAGSRGAGDRQGTGSCAAGTGALSAARQRRLLVGVDEAVAVGVVAGEVALHLRGRFGF